ncbi:MAG: hypothetical protein ABW252_05625 [Polyangiales bacterium]
MHWVLRCSLVLTLLGFALAGSAATGDVGAPSPATLVVIIGKSAGAKDISYAQLRRVFGGDAGKIGSNMLTPFNYVPDHPMRRRFDTLVLAMTPDEIGRYWVDRRVRGLGLPPRTVPSPQTMKGVIARLPGAIGYIDASQVDDSVQVLSIDGKGFRDPGYRLLPR